jgi:hypothetical protein
MLVPQWLEQSKDPAAMRHYLLTVSFKCSADWMERVIRNRQELWIEDQAMLRLVA